LIQIKDIMESVASDDIPLIAEGGQADNWAEAH
jgi:DNA polymerase I-like protein with 3'-5' exonuclease and polymerase domains